MLLLADGYPNHCLPVDEGALQRAKGKNLRVYLEYPKSLPGYKTGEPKTTAWERVVVSSDWFAPELQPMRILAAHDAHFVPIETSSASDLVVARVAGFDRAIYGLPTNNVYPILFRLPESKLIIATTRLSGFVQGRYAPISDWVRIWEHILTDVDPGSKHVLRVEPVVQTSFSPNRKLPRRFEQQAFDRAASWFVDSGLLVTAKDAPSITRSLSANGELMDPPAPGSKPGDGSLGILEGYSSAIRYDGLQPRRLPLRADCNAESGMVLALDSIINRKASSGIVASNLLEFVYFNSNMCKGARNDPTRSAYGLIGWGDISPAWLVANYGDDDARAILASAMVSVCLKTSRWDDKILRAVLANFRTAGKFGFRGDRLDMPALARQSWTNFHSASTVNYSPHFEAYLWACYLWAYHQTGYQPLLDTAKTAISMTMKVYPDQWRWQDNLERAHMLLPLAWLVRVSDTAEHRQWLITVAGNLLKDQSPTGSIHERLGNIHGGHYRTPQRNEEYGTAETPLLQENGDPVSDQLYTTGFALLGLHEAAEATGDSALKQAENKLAEFLCRIQTKSTAHRFLDGTWFRAFDDRRWEPWASSADVGWGAWSLEAGWGQAWIGGMLAIRTQKTSVWQELGKSRVQTNFARIKDELGLKD